MVTVSTCQLYLTRAMAVCAGMCACAVFLYGTFLLLAVAHTAARTHAQSSIEEKKARVSDLEAIYLAQTKQLTPQRAAELGFTAPVHISTVFASSPVNSLSLRIGN